MLYAKPNCFIQKDKQTNKIIKSNIEYFVVLISCRYIRVDQVFVHIRLRGIKKRRNKVKIH